MLHLGYRGPLFRLSTRIFSLAKLLVHLSFNLYATNVAPSGFVQRRCCLNTSEAYQYAIHLPAFRGQIPACQGANVLAAWRWSHDACLCEFIFVAVAPSSSLLVSPEVTWSKLDFAMHDASHFHPLMYYVSPSSRLNLPNVQTSSKPLTHPRSGMFTLHVRFSSVVEP